MKKLVSSFVVFSMLAVLVSRAEAAEPSVTMNFSTYWGCLAGAAVDQSITSVKFDGSNNVIVFGHMNQAAITEFPGARDFGPVSRHTNAGGADLFVAKLSADGSRIIWMTFIGGSNNDYGGRMTVGPDGSIYLTAQTYSDDFPIVQGVRYVNGYPGQGALMKLNSDGSQLMLATNLINHSQLNAVAVNSRNEIYVGGNTTETLLPNAVNATGGTGYPAGGAGFVSKLSADGQTFLYSRSIGTNLYKGLGGIVVNANDELVVVGESIGLLDAITPDAFQKTVTGGEDIYLVKLNPTGSVLYGSYFGGGDTDHVWDVAQDTNGDVVLSGLTWSSNFPVRNAARTRFEDEEAFVLKLNAANQVVFSSFIGGSRRELANSVSFGPAGKIYVSGYTTSSDLLTTPNAFQREKHASTGDDIFVQIYSSAGTLDYSTYLGGSVYQTAPTLATNPEGAFVVTSHTESTNFPTTTGSLHPISVGATGSYKNTISKFSVSDVDIKFTIPNYLVKEGPGLVFIPIAGNVPAGMSVDLVVRTEQGTALEGLDFEPFNAIRDNVTGSLQWSLALRILDDQIIEPDETMKLYLSVTDHNTRNVLSQSSAVVTIQDDDNEIGFRGPATDPGDPSKYKVNEDVPSGMIPVTLYRRGDMTKEVSVSMTYIGGSATLNSDFNRGPATVTWPVGDASDKIINIPIIKDNVTELPEFFQVSMGLPTGGAVIAPNLGSAEITISDGEVIEVNIEAPRTFNEDVGSIRLVAKRLGSKNGKIKLAYKTANVTAQAGSDYSETVGTIEFADQDDQPKEFFVPILDDKTVETDEDFSMTVDAVEKPNSTAFSWTSGMTFTIVDDDVPDHRIQWEPAELTVSEIDMPNEIMKVKLRRLGDSKGTIRAHVKSIFDSALQGADYLAVDELITWADGDVTDKEITIFIVSDNIFEPTEVFYLQVDSLESAQMEGNSVKKITIFDDDGNPGVINSIWEPRVSESQGNTHIGISRTQGKDGVQRISYQTNSGSAFAGVDFTSVSGTIVFNDQEDGQKEIVIPILNDALSEPEKSFFVRLTYLDGSQAGEAFNAAIAIVDDDVSPPPLPGLVRVTRLSPESVTENVGKVAFRFERVGGNDGILFFNIKTIALTAEVGSDFIPIEETLFWGDKENSPIDKFVSITDDVEVDEEHFEFFDLFVSGPMESGHSFDVFATSIEDNDVAPTPVNAPSEERSKNLVNLSKNEQAEIRFNSNSNGTIIDVVIYDRQGRLIRTLNYTGGSPGVQTIPWNGRDDNGVEVMAGLYQALIKGEGKTQKLPIVITK